MNKKSSPVSAVAVLDLAQDLLSLGVIDLPWLQHHQPEVIELMRLKKANSLGIEEKRLDEALLISLWRQVEKNTVHPHVGLLIGQKVNVEAKGVLVNWISQCETFEEAFNTFRNHIGLLNQSESWQLKKSEGLFELIFCFQPALEYPAVAVERSMSAMVCWSQFYVERKLIPLEVSFTFDKPEDTQIFTEIFGENLSFNAHQNSLVFHDEVLNYPLVSANQYLKQVMSERAKTIMDTLESVEEVSLRIALLLKSDLAKYCQLDKVCDELHMSRSTLYRKLKAEDTSFSEVLENARVEYQARAVKAGVPAAELYSLLGYKDASSYYKKFKHN